MAEPKIFIGLLIGGAVPFLFSALAIRAVGRTAGVVVQEVRSQFADGEIMAGTKKPDYGPVIDICTAASLRELATPALLAVLTPVVIGFGIGWQALGGFLAAVILVGQLMANYLSNAGGAWDNAKKYIEDGHHGGKGSDAHKAAVIGDTVGDPFKDTAGPALNPLIKVMNLVSLLMLPAIINCEVDENAVPLRRRRRRAARPHRRHRLVIAQDRGHDGALARRRDCRCPRLRELSARRPRVPQAGVVVRQGRRGRPAGRHGDHLRRVRAALRVLPARRLAAVLHRLPDLVGGPDGPHVLRVRRAHPVAAGSCSSASRRRRSSATRSATCSASKVGPSLFNRPNSRLFKAENVAKAHVFFERHGAKSIVLARFVPIVRTFTPIVAGIGEMRYRTFVTYNVLGGLLWAVGVTTLGHFLGEIEFFRENIEFAIIAVVLISLVPVAIEVYRSPQARQPRPRRRAAEATAPPADGGSTPSASSQALTTARPRRRRP